MKKIFLLIMGIIAFALGGCCLSCCDDDTTTETEIVGKTWLLVTTDDYSITYSYRSDNTFSMVQLLDTGTDYSYSEISGTYTLNKLVKPKTQTLTFISTKTTETKGGVLTEDTTIQGQKGTYCYKIENDTLYLLLSSVYAVVGWNYTVQDSMPQKFTEKK